MDERTIARFWAKVDKGAGLDGCWLWTASKDTAGYGHLRAGGKMMTAHRVSWRLRNGAIPPHVCVCHRCDVRACCNPAHMFLGTNAENVADKVAKGRQARCIGEENPGARITEATVANLRADRSSGLSQRKLAARYGISQSQVRNIIGGKHWAHV